MEQLRVPNGLTINARLLLVKSMFLRLKNNFNKSLSFLKRILAFFASFCVYYRREQLKIKLTNDKFNRLPKVFRGNLPGFVVESFRSFWLLNILFLKTKRIIETCRFFYLFWSNCGSRSGTTGHKVFLMDQHFNIYSCFPL